MAAQFLTGNELNLELEKLFEAAKEHLILISPYISLHERYASVLKAKLDNDKLAITLVFGKNEEDPSRSMRKADLDFFMQFPNIEIRYEPRLHAKYYASDEVALITSMNLYKYSQDHNIEAGVLMETTTADTDLANKLLGRKDIEATAYTYFTRVIEQAELIYRKEPAYEKGLLGLTKKYIKSEVKTDRIAEFFSNDKVFGRTRSTPKSQTAPEVPLAKQAVQQIGYCIRTGKAIPFNAKRPLSDEAYANWARYKDEKYKEKFCHFSGEPSNGETSFARPILSKNWSKAKATFSF